MATDYDDAVAELFQKPHDEYVAERKRLQGELKAAGDKAGASRIAKLKRPPISAWAVNQLWWQAQPLFEKLFETAERLRDGDLAGTAAHRDAIAALRAKAGEILVESGHAASEGTLRRIATTVSAIGAIGGWDPDPPGALTEDRDPPGFEAAGIPGLAEQAAAEIAHVKAKLRGEVDDDDDKAQKVAGDVARLKAALEASEKAEAATARRKAEQEKAKKVADRHRHEAALRTARGDVERRQRELERLRKAADDAEQALGKAKAIDADLEAKVEELSDDEE
jgi:hypothetical protein